jgi:uncharacterized protein YxjI
MDKILENNLYFIKEHLGTLKAANNYDIYEPKTNQLLLVCREENLGFFTKLFRFTGWKTKTPFDVEIKTPEGKRIIRVKRGFSLFVSRVQVFAENDLLVAKFDQKFFSLGGKFTIKNAHDQPVCTLQGEWTSWNFKFISQERGELAWISKKWSGIGKELFTTADNYMLEINEQVSKNDRVREMILAAVMCIDMVLKER